MFSVLLAGCSIDYTEYKDYAIVDSIGQCTRSRCAYTAHINGVTLHFTGSPITLGYPIPIKIRIYKDGRVEYYE